MLTNDSPHSEYFQELLGQIREEVDTLKSQAEQLEEENKTLKSKLEKHQQEDADVFARVKETDRMAFKHQIRGLIKKIDEHLEDQP